MPMIVAIDGPAGAGKSSVARRVAAALEYLYIDTGAMYRALAWKAMQQGLDTRDEAAMAAMARRMQLTLSPLASNLAQTVTADGEDVTGEIRAPEVSQQTSIVSALPAVRRVIVERQREMARAAARGVVLEGRDIGTVVFPQADVKIFLTASPEERARRRHAELRAKGVAADYAAVLREQKDRDARDTTRADSPLRAAPDAVTVTTDGLSIEEVVARILARVPQHG